MKILSLHLHPFGGTMDRTCILQGGLNVLEGPNEFGKSTLAHALWSALFIPTNLTPAKLRDQMGRWYPRPDGDHVSVTLQFQVQDQPWTLSKTWGAGATSRLQPEGGAAMADPDAVQAKLDALRRWNQATWRHVLFTRQAEIAGTIERLRRKADALDDVHGLLAGAAAIPGDVPADRLIDALDDRINHHFARWDRTTDRPEKGRGIDNPWKNRLGPVVEAWYAVERLRRDLRDVEAHEEAVDDLNRRVQELTAEIEKTQPFVEEGKRLRDGLSRRGTLEEKRARLTGIKDTLMEIVTAWPGAEQVMKGKKEEQERLEEALKQVDEELEQARERADAEKLRKGYKALVDARTRWESADERLKQTEAIDSAALDELRGLEGDLDALRIQIAAQKLSFTLESTDSRALTLVRGAEEAEEITLAPDQPWDGEAAGRIRIEADGLRIQVRSGQDDVDSLFSRQEEATRRRNDLLETVGHEGLAEAEAAEKAREALVQKAAHQRSLYESALQGQEPEDWEADIARIDALPETRALDTLEQERKKLLSQQADLKAKIQQLREKVEAWENEYQDLDTLMEKVVRIRGDLTDLEKQLVDLPDLPEGFESVDAYLERVREEEEVESRAREEYQEARQELALLMGQTPERTVEDLKAEMDLKKRDLERCRADGAALLRIRSTLDQIVEARSEEDPLSGLAEAVSQHFDALTDGRYAEVVLDGTAPAQVEGTSPLPITHLSQGTLGSLALATRLALAELYLGENGGFVMMDDPFTDMDPARRAAAAHTVGTFAADRQLIFFTCHPGHAEELQERAGGEIVTVS